MKIKRTDDAVSEIVGTVLLLMIAVAVFSGIYIIVLTPPSDIPQPFVTITGKMEGTNIILTHRGGDSLPLSSLLSVTVGDSTNSTIVGDCLDSASKDDGRWNIGEKLKYSLGSIANQEVRVLITDVDSHSALFIGVLHGGETDMTPTVTTLNATHIDNKSATLNMFYDFKDYGSGDVRFAYKKQSEGNWTNTSWSPKQGLHAYHKHITNLDGETTYEFKAQLRYGITVISGETKLFTTTDGG